MFSILAFIFRQKAIRCYKKAKANSDKAAGLVPSKTLIKQKAKINLFSKLFFVGLAIDILIILAIIMIVISNNFMDRLGRSGAWLGTDSEILDQFDEDYVWEYNIDEYVSQVQQEYNSQIMGSFDERKRVLEILYEEYENFIYPTSGYKYKDWGNTVNGNIGREYWWCATFVGWIFNEAGITYESSNEDDSTIGKLKSFNFRSCTAWINYATKMGWETHKRSSEPNYTPSPGDLIVYWDGSKYSHIGIVFEVNSNGDIITIEGNTSRLKDGTSGAKEYSGNAVGLKNRRNGTASGYWKDCTFITIPYKVATFDEDLNFVYQTGNFDLSRYSKGSDGYYSQETVQQILYDFFIQAMGYNSAAACGALANLRAECSFCYDIAETDYDGRLWLFNSSKTSCSEYSDYFVPKSGGNGNYGSYKDESTIIYAPVNTLIYQRSTTVMKDNTRYAGGIGIVQWSDGRRVALMSLRNSTDWVYGPPMGPNSLMCQLMYMKQELEGSYYSTRANNNIKSVTNDLAGAKQAAYQWQWNYEVCRSEKTKVVRQSYAEEMWKKFGSTLPTGS